MVAHAFRAPAKVVARLLPFKPICRHKVDAARVRIFFRREVFSTFRSHLRDLFGRELPARLLGRLEARQALFFLFWRLLRQLFAIGNIE